MNFDDTSAEAVWRSEVRNWLAQYAPQFAVQTNRERNAADFLEAAKAWQACKADAGYAGLTWPREFGGQGLSHIWALIFAEEEARYLLPVTPFVIGLGICLPALMRHADKSLLDRYLARALRGAEIWCQLFSEPAAGSDLAGIRTTATRDGGAWIVNGQKVWTSGAHYSDFGLLLARTDPTKPKHKGLTAFVLDMRSQGVDVRPIRQMNNGANFNEVFFSDVRISDSQRVGEPCEGWKVALTTLMNERMAVGGDLEAVTGFSEITAFAARCEIDGVNALDHGAVRAKLADWYAKAQGLRFTRYRTVTALSRGETPGPEASITKLVLASRIQEIGGIALELLGHTAFASGAQMPADITAFQGNWLWGAGLRIAGGTDEVLRNIIAERVLDLPPDIRIDKLKPFNAVAGTN